MGRRSRRILALSVLALAPTLRAEEAPAPAAPAQAVVASVPAGEYTGGGVGACTECHDQAKILAILKSPHGVKGDARTPLAHGETCETCHGPGAAHAGDPDNARISIAFGQSHPIQPQNEKCLSCHQGGSRIHWKGSEHEQHDIACAACHTVHAIEDPVLVRDVDPTTIAKHDQTERCYTCHPDIRAQANRMSTHPIREGRVLCSDCHNPHGSTTDHLLAQETVNETCYECHAEKRGPFLWEHQPARDDCTTCHTPHGSTHKNLLVARGPWLCQQCHLASFHPSGAYDGSGLARTTTPNRNLLANNCLNCHSEVHGSNHPSGVRFTR
jgi:DmsE family decaheme c-type cytochrome